MPTLKIKIPEDMGEDLDEYIEESGAYLNKSELVRVAIRRYFEDYPLSLSERTLRDAQVSREQIASGDVVPLSDIDD